MHNRQGSVYIVVLMASLIVASMALASIETMRWHALDSYAEAEYQLAQIGADAGLEAALGMIHHNANWRTNFVSNVDSSPLTFGNTSVRYRFIDSDGDLSDNPLDDCDVIVTATNGDARYALRGTLKSDGSALDCLGYAIAADKRIESENFANIASDFAVATNDRVNIKSGGYLTGDCFSTGAMNGDIYGSLNALAADVSIPTATVLDPYIAEGTVIEYGSLPTATGAFAEIRGQLLSDSTNTINGTVNPNGVYVIDCSNQKIRIVDSRIKGTLVLIDPSLVSEIAGSVHWEAAIPNYPILLTNGEINLKTRRTALSEAAIGVNFNPPGTPYRGSSDNTTTTSYPSQLRGMIYAETNFDVTSIVDEAEVFGTVITRGECHSAGVLIVNYRDIYLYDPPPGFRNSDRMTLVAGSIRRVTPP